MAKQDIQAIITDKIIAELEAGTKPWVQPWVANGQSVMPTNLKTGTAYTGMNIMLLWLAARTNDFSSQYWATYNQAADLGGQVRKGAKGTTLIFYKTYDKEDKATGEKESYRVMRSFTVFNIDQIDGIELPAPAPIVPMDERYARAQAFIDATGIKIMHGFQQACYIKGANVIHMPAPQDFNTEADYWATLFHETAHASAHSSRLDRQMGAKGNPEYAVEEIIVEIASCMLMEHFGIKGDVQHESYIAFWLEALGADKNYIFKAAGAASKIFNYFKQFDAAATAEDEREEEAA